MPRRSHTRNHLHTIILLVPCITLACLVSSYTPEFLDIIQATPASAPAPVIQSSARSEERSIHPRSLYPPPPLPASRLLQPFRPESTAPVTYAIPRPAEASGSTRHRAVARRHIFAGRAVRPVNLVGPVVQQEKPVTTEEEGLRPNSGLETRRRMWRLGAQAFSVPGNLAQSEEKTTPTSSDAIRSPHPRNTVKPLFPPFEPSQWHAVDDRVRGGSSTSCLEVVRYDLDGRGGPSRAGWRGTNGSADQGNDVDGTGLPSLEQGGIGSFKDEQASGPRNGEGSVRSFAARFWGQLDTQTLGGAGFASQSYTFSPRLSLPESSYTGLQISLLPAHDRSPISSEPGKRGEAKHPDQFTLVLKSEKPGTRPDGRREAVLSYEHTFTAPSASELPSVAGQVKSISIPWSDFDATYRGRKIDSSDPMYVPLQPGIVNKPVSLRSAAYAQWSEKPSPGDGTEEDEPSGNGGIYELSLMCRSNFGKQEGDFELFVLSIGAERVGVPEWDGVGGEGRVVRIAEQTGLLAWFGVLGVLELITRVVIGICAGCQWVLRYFSQAQESSIRLP